MSTNYEVSNIEISHFRENNRKYLIPYVTSLKALVHVLTMVESNDSSCSAESDDDSFLSGSVNYSTECTDEQSISDISVSAEMGAQPCQFEPEVSDSESANHDDDDHWDDFYSLNPERVGNNHW